MPIQRTSSQERASLERRARAAADRALAPRARARAPSPPAVADREAERNARMIAIMQEGQQRNQQAAHIWRNAPPVLQLNPEEQQARRLQIEAEQAAIPPHLRAAPIFERQNAIGSDERAQLREIVPAIQAIQAAHRSRSASAKTANTKVTNRTPSGKPKPKRRRSPQGSNESTQSDATSKRPKTHGGATHIHNGRSYKVHTGSQGGKYIVSKGQKIYI